jgi:Mrp family chromosome partitioning ATPase
MALEQQIEERLEKIIVPGMNRSIVKAGLVRSIIVSDGQASLKLASTALGDRLKEELKNAVTASVGELDDIKQVSVEYIDMTPKDVNQVKNVIAIMSGKGGVGKSLVTSLTAVALRREGYDVGILDADITGPSIPRMFGINGRPEGAMDAMMPVPSRSGIGLMSINLLLPEEDEAVIWRGPLIARVITQFWEQVVWGKLDYLLVDLPPGTADAPLTVMQNLPVSGIIIVFTPQDLTKMVVRKAVKMAEKLQKPVIGVVENMSHLYVPEIDKKIELFGPSRGKEMAESTGAPLLASMPIDPSVARLCDEGNIESYDGEMMQAYQEALRAVTGRNGR